jgi:hypothetical protein
LTASAQRARWRRLRPVIGRDFSHGLLRAVVGMDDLALQATLDRLAEADILLVQGVPPQSEYRFKHVLIQDAAYENLLKSRRWNPVKAEYDDWRGMGTRAAIAARSLEAQGPVHYCPKEWLNDGWLDKPKGR